MLHSIKVHGMRVKETTGLKRLPDTKEGKAFGRVPGKVAVHDPDYAGVLLGWARERVENTKSPFSGVISELSNGQKMFGAENDSDMTRIDFDAEVDPKRWSVVHVMKPFPRALGTGPGVLTEFENAANTPEDFAINLGFTRGGDLENLILYQNTREAGADTRLVYNGANFGLRNTPSIVMATFSVERGLALFDGGVMVASSPDDKAPLTQYNGRYNHYRNGRGQFGFSMLLSTDLSDPENAGFKRAIEQFLMQKYGIPPAPQ